MLILDQWSRRALTGMREMDLEFSSFKLILDFGVDVGMWLLLFGVLLLPTQLSGVLEAPSFSMVSAAFLGGVEKKSMLSSSSKIRFFLFFAFLTAIFSSDVSDVASLLEIAVDISLSVSFFMRFSSFFFGAASVATIGVRAISTIGDLKLNL